MDQISPRQLDPGWNYGMLAVVAAISLLGAFTSTQLMCQAKTAPQLSTALTWAILSGFTFSFCATWCVHFVALLAMEFDVPMEIDVTWTVASAVLAISFTVAAFSSDFLSERYGRMHKKKQWKTRKAYHSRRRSHVGHEERFRTASALITPEADPRQNTVYPGHSRLDHVDHSDFGQNESYMETEGRSFVPRLRFRQAPKYRPLSQVEPNSPRENEHNYTSIDVHHDENPTNKGSALRAHHDVESIPDTETDDTLSQTSNTFTDSSNNSLGVRNISSIRAYARSASSAKHAFSNMFAVLSSGFTIRNLFKAFVWSSAITGMHFLGVMALRIPEGFYILDPYLVILTAILNFIMSALGCILMPNMESNLAQQLVCAAIFAIGIGAKHMIGMTAFTFHTSAPPSDNRGFRKGLDFIIASLAIITCIAFSGLLAHSATSARNRLAEIVQTRRKLWAAIAQKDNAEAAAAARSEFIASASHEIRTPLHQLQGYSDLLSKTEMTEEGHMLLLAIQHATKTLSMITNNVLDWSRLEKGESACEPTALDIRNVCESVLNLLPRRDDEIHPDLFVVVSPEVPDLVFVDETYIHRILMNLLFNALKFTSAGYVMLLVEFLNGNLLITVKDTGSGISETFMPHLFEPFKQAQVRGAQRGTGLGLTIVSKLLERMQGTITVESRCKDGETLNSDTSGTTFRLTIPVAVSDESLPSSYPSEGESTIMIFSDGDNYYTEGLTLAWEKFGVRVSISNSFDESRNLSTHLIWADLSFLEKNPSFVKYLTVQKSHLVLIPWEVRSHLDEMIGSNPPPHIIPLQKPLSWHRIFQDITSFGKALERPRPDKIVRFNPIVDMMSGEKISTSGRTAIIRGTILLVEDNKINQRLGIKMLKSLKYEVLIAEDGVEAIEEIQKHDQTIDAILMDQSMPRKDGATATREIRTMEANGLLSRRRPIIAVTAVVGAEAQELCRQAGTDAFLAKPLALAKLEQTLASYLPIH